VVIFALRLDPWYASNLSLLIGAPLVRTPDKDDHEFAKPENVNDFKYDSQKGQTVCPFAVHTRKSNPRTEESKKHLLSLTHVQIDTSAEVRLLV